MVLPPLTMQKLQPHAGSVYSVLNTANFFSANAAVTLPTNHYQTALALLIMQQFLFSLLTRLRYITFYQRCFPARRKWKVKFYQRHASFRNNYISRWNPSQFSTTTPKPAPTQVSRASEAAATTTRSSEVYGRTSQNERWRSAKKNKRKNGRFETFAKLQSLRQARFRCS